MIGFLKEGKLFLQPSTVEEKPAWEKYLYSSPKTDMMLFFNSVTAEIYNADRYDVMQDIKSLD